MARNIKTHIICYDDQRGLSEEVNKRFIDNSRYEILSFQTRDEVMGYFARIKDHNSCKIVIIGLHDNREQYSSIELLTHEIRKADRDTRIIVVGPSDRMEEIKNAAINDIEAFVPRNSNTILRIHNTVKKIMSEHNIGVFRRRKNLSLYSLIIFLIIAGLTAIISYFRFPYYF